jgi:hypothetical protein
VVVAAFNRNRCNGVGRRDHRHLPARQIGGEVGQSIVLLVRPAILDRHGLAFDQAALANAAPKRGHKVGATTGRRGAEHPDHRHGRLLRARRKRPRRRAADERYELAPFHCPMPPVLPTERIAHPCTAGDCCAAGFRPGL